MQLRIYGDETKFRRALAQYVKRADELLDQAVGVHKRMEAMDADSLVVASLFAGSDWGDAVSRWRTSVIRGLDQYLHEQADGVLPLTSSWPRGDDGRRVTHLGLKEGHPWLEAARSELVALQDSVGVRRAIASHARPARFTELRSSGLVEEKVIADYEKAMLNPRTPRQLSNAIGSSKEITEAVLRAALERLDVGWVKGDGLTALMKKWRQSVDELAPPDPSSRHILDQAQSALGNVVRFLAEWRNDFGTGHGRPQYPPDLRVRHARLATDAAEMSVRFIVLTLDDLQRLPPDLNEPPTEGQGNT